MAAAVIVPDEARLMSDISDLDPRLRRINADRSWRWRREAADMRAHAAALEATAERTEAIWQLQPQTGSSPSPRPRPNDE